MVVVYGRQHRVIYHYHDGTTTLCGRPIDPPYPPEYDPLWTGPLGELESGYRLCRRCGAVQKSQNRPV
jgi:hypothetical protein